MDFSRQHITLTHHGQRVILIHRDQYMTLTYRHQPSSMESQLLQSLAECKSPLPKKIYHSPSIKKAIANDGLLGAFNLVRDNARNVAHDVANNAREVAREVARDVASEVARDVARADGFPPISSDHMNDSSHALIVRTTAGGGMDLRVRDTNGDTPHQQLVDQSAMMIRAAAESMVLEAKSKSTQNVVAPILSLSLAAAVLAVIAFRRN